MSTVQMLPTMAQLTLKAISIKNGQHLVVEQGLLWELEGPQAQTSADARPQFIVKPGEYQLTALHQGEPVQVTKIKLTPGMVRDEVVYLDVAGDTRYQVGQDEFNPDTEFQRREMERDGQRKFGQAVNPLQPPPDGAQFGNGQMIAAHPLLANAAQFSGVDPKMSTPDQNPHTEENAKNPDLVPGAKPNPAPTAAPGPSVSPIPSPLGR